jgi:RNA polymerase sigma-70 factor (sigma-E family)
VSTQTRLRDRVTGRHARHPVGPSSIAGAEQAVSVLFREHRVGLTRLALLLVDDEATAQDVVQEAFLGLYQRYDRLRDPASAVDYLRSAVLNLSRSVLRRRRTARGYVPRHEAPARSAESLAMMRAEHRQVIAALATIGERQREVLVLRYWAGLSEAQIAAATGLSAGAVKSTASRGLVALEKKLQVQATAPGGYGGAR